MHRTPRKLHAKDQKPLKTDAEIAVEFGISEARVMQLRNRALRKIRETILDDPELIELASELCGFDVQRSKGDEHGPA